MNDGPTLVGLCSLSQREEFREATSLNANSLAPRFQSNPKSNFDQRLGKLICRMNRVIDSVESLTLLMTHVSQDFADPTQRKELRPVISLYLQSGVQTGGSYQKQVVGIWGRMRNPRAAIFIVHPIWSINKNTPNTPRATHSFSWDTRCGTRNRLAELLSYTTAYSPVQRPRPPTVIITEVTPATCIQGCSSNCALRSIIAASHSIVQHPTLIRSRLVRLRSTSVRTTLCSRGTASIELFASNIRASVSNIIDDQKSASSATL